MAFSPSIQKLVDQAVAERTKARKAKELLVGRAVGHGGKVLAKFQGYNLQSIMGKLDAAVPECWSKDVRGEWTSDGTYWGPGRGRLLASREAQMLEINGVQVWHKDWLVE